MSAAQLVQNPPPLSSPHHQTGKSQLRQVLTGRRWGAASRRSQRRHVHTLLAHGPQHANPGGFGQQGKRSDSGLDLVMRKHHRMASVRTLDVLASSTHLGCVGLGIAHEPSLAHHPHLQLYAYDRARARRRRNTIDRRRAGGKPFSARATPCELPAEFSQARGSVWIRYLLLPIVVRRSSWTPSRLRWSIQGVHEWVSDRSIGRRRAENGIGQPRRRRSLKARAEAAIAR